MRKGIGRLRRRQMQRRNRWISRGLRPSQANLFIDYPINRPYMRYFHRLLFSMQELGVGTSGLSREELMALWRQAYDRSVRLGEYDPPRNRRYDRPHRKLNADGSIDYQHGREYEVARRAKAKAKVQRRLA